MEQEAGISSIRSCPNQSLLRNLTFRSRRKDLSDFLQKKQLTDKNLLPTRHNSQPHLFICGTHIPEDRISYSSIPYRTRTSVPQYLNAFKKDPCTTASNETFPASGGHPFSSSDLYSCDLGPTGLLILRKMLQKRIFPGFDGITKAAPGFSDVAFNSFTDNYFFTASLPAAYRSIRPSGSAGTQRDEITIALGDVHAGEIHAHDAYGLVQRRHGTVMKIRSRQFDVAQVRDLEAVTRSSALPVKPLSPSSSRAGCRDPQSTPS